MAKKKNFAQLQQAIFTRSAKMMSNVIGVSTSSGEEEMVNQVTIKVLGHRKSQATRVMEMLEVQSIVRVRIRTDVETCPRAATCAQLEELDSYIREQVLCRMPFPKGQGQIIYCRHDSSFTDECILNSYQAVLDTVFGKGHVHARIYTMTKACDYE